MRRMTSAALSAVLHLLFLIAFPSKMPSTVPSEGAAKKIPVLLLPSNGNRKAEAPLQPVKKETTKNKPSLSPSKPVPVPELKSAPSPTEASASKEAKIPKVEEERPAEPASPLAEELHLQEEIASIPSSDINGEIKERGNQFASAEQKPGTEAKGRYGCKSCWSGRMGELSGRAAGAHRGGPCLSRGGPTEGTGGPRSGTDRRGSGWPDLECRTGGGFSFSAPQSGGGADDSLFVSSAAAA